MSGFHFISYSRADGGDVAAELQSALTDRAPRFNAWLDSKNIRPGLDWDDQVEDAVRSCETMLFLMTPDSVTPESECKKEWSLALRCKKMVVPILLSPDAETPFRLSTRQYIDATGGFDTTVSEIKTHLQWLASPEGELHALMQRLKDAERDKRRAGDATREARIQLDIDLLERQIENQRRILEDPEAAQKQTQTNIDSGIELEQRPEKPAPTGPTVRFIYPPPGTVPDYFQDRVLETKLVGDCLKSDNQRLCTVVARGGIGKTSLVCRLLKGLENGQLPDDGGPLTVDGIVYLSERGSHGVTLNNIFTGLAHLLPQEKAEELHAIYLDETISTAARTRKLCDMFADEQVVLLLDNFEDILDPETRAINDAELNDALRALLEHPHHKIKVIITSRIAPKELNLIHPERQRTVRIDEGLPSPFAENILREMDADGCLGLRDADDELLAQARERTGGNPRAVEALFALLSADVDTSLEEILENTQKLLPDNVVSALVGEAFSRLDANMQRVMEGLAIYDRPVSRVAMDYLLQPYIHGVDTAPMLNRLVNMHFVRRESDRYYLHPVDREFALSRIPDGEPGDKNLKDPTPFSRYALRHRAADFFSRVRKPREEWNDIADLRPQLAEIELRCSADEHEEAATILSQIDHGYLAKWGHYGMLIGLYERIRPGLRHPILILACENGLANTYWRTGRLDEAVRLFRGLHEDAQRKGDRRLEKSFLTGLANCYDDLGETRMDIECTSKACSIAQEIGDRLGEASALNNLSVGHQLLGNLDTAGSYATKALELATLLRQEQLMGHALSNQGNVLCDQGRYAEAIKCFEESKKLFDEAGFVQYQGTTRQYLALTKLVDGDLEGAKLSIQDALNYCTPQVGLRIHVCAGIIHLLLGNETDAKSSFRTAVSNAQELLEKTARNVKALDIKGVGLCGLSLCDDENHITEAIATFRAGRAINNEKGNVFRVCRFIDALANADSNKVLAPAREAASGA